ncbi:hypothetical protein ACFQAT_15005 [Undibacterium arcticum]|uniref:Uncharacterized protein n=1 Tax=Undibacterium arcticum TaxID=1762892 RepID=A0ABV7F399_9BURK
MPAKKMAPLVLAFAVGAIAGALGYHTLGFACLGIAVVILAVVCWIVPSEQSLLP